ncbi:MAG: homoserine dehydrogenase [Ignavibacteria bacterium]|nr:homoserine dehydrogenase [Ignavibacteria bacterium]
MVNLGLIGLGTVGKGLYSIVNNEYGGAYRFEKLCDVRGDLLSTVEKHNTGFTQSYNEILGANGKLDVIVELIDNALDSSQIAKQILRNGKKLVTANKKMIAENLSALISLQQQFGGKLCYEGAVCGCIPIIRVLEEFYQHVQINSLEMICNGTTNFILSQIFRQGLSYKEALAEATRLGFVESNPLLDLAGYDSKNKLVILLAHAFGIIEKPENIYNAGIQNLTDADIQVARGHNMKIKLIAKAVKHAGTIQAFVMPSYIKASHQLYGIENEYNAVVVDSENYGIQCYTGKGAGSIPTATVVASDIESITKGYRYKYHKLNDSTALDNDAHIRVYARIPKDSVLSGMPWVDIHHALSLEDADIYIGTIALKELLARPVDSDDKSFIALFDED